MSSVFWWRGGQVVNQSGLRLCGYSAAEYTSNPGPADGHFARGADRSVMYVYRLQLTLVIGLHRLMVCNTDCQGILSFFDGKNKAKLLNKL